MPTPPASLWIEESTLLWTRPGYTLELEAKDGKDGYWFWTWSAYWLRPEDESDGPAKRLISRSHRWGKRVRSWDVPRKWANRCIVDWEGAL